MTLNLNVAARDQYLYDILLGNYIGKRLFGFCRNAAENVYCTIERRRDGKIDVEPVGTQRRMTSSEFSQILTWVMRTQIMLGIDPTA